MTNQVHRVATGITVHVLRRYTSTRAVPSQPSSMPGLQQLDRIYFPPRALRVIAMFLLGVTCLTRADARTFAANVAWQPVKLVSGSPVLFQISAARAKSISGEWMGHKLSFFRPRAGSAWYALAGISVETKPGSYELQINEMFVAGSRQITKKVKIGTANYPKIAAHVATKFTEPSTEQMKEISADKDLKTKVLATESPERLWRGRFEAPVEFPISDIFGTERVFNGAVQSRHLGLDFAAPAGTEVHAVNSGTVILAQPLYFEGGFVVIDHGEGLLSLYLHLSQFRVKEGEQVTSGQVLGLSGSSGRATGPHLHLAIRWQGIYMDPAVVLRLQIQ